jgi:hypothetical protein
METPKEKEKMGGKNGGKIQNLFEDMEYHPHNQKSFNKQTQKQGNNKFRQVKKGQ